MKASITKKITLAVVIVTLVILAVTWWANGQDDTWLYVTSALIVFTSFFYMTPRKKDGDQ